MKSDDALNEICNHLLGKNWYIADPVGSDQARDIIVDEIKKNYPAKNETAVDKWRRRHKRCAWCTHCKSGHIFNPNSLSVETRYDCEAKEHWNIKIDRPRPFCTLFILKNEFWNGSNKNDYIRKH